MPRNVAFINAVKVSGHKAGELFNVFKPDFQLIKKQAGIAAWKGAFPRGSAIRPSFFIAKKDGRAVRFHQAGACLEVYSGFSGWLLNRRQAGVFHQKSKNRSPMKACFGASLHKFFRFPALFSPLPRLLFRRFFHSSSSVIDGTAPK